MASGNQPFLFDLALQSSAVANGNGTSLGVGGLSIVGVQVKGLGTATITFEGTVNDSDWVSLLAYNFATGASATTTTADGIFSVPVAGLDLLRARISGWSSGTITVTAKGIPGTNALPAIQASQGAAASASGYWTVRLSDGTNLSPSMDAAARPGYVKVTDGTNSLPTGDVAARKVFVAPCDGTNQFLSASATNFAATNGSTNACLVGHVADWVATSAPAVNTQATASKTAGSAGVRHVCTSVSFSLCQDTTGGTPYTGTVNLRDGATGAGSILATWYIACPTAACSNATFALSGLNIPGTAATAMTLEFTGASGAHSQESCTITGYDVV